MRIVSHTISGLVFLFLSTSVSAAEYIFIGNGAWSNPANWAGKIIPPRNLKAGNTITISGNAITTAECCENDFESNSGTVIISVGGSLTLQNATQFGNHGSIIILGSLVTKTHFEVYNTSSITIAISGSFTNQLWLGNQGLITINGGTPSSSRRVVKLYEVSSLRMFYNVACSQRTGR
jgi:hypothetical protein